MNLNLRELWARVQRWYANHSERDRRIIAGLAVAVGLSLVYVGVVDRLRAYQHRVAEEISDGQEQLERSARFVGAIDGLRAEREDLRKRLAQAKSRLLPGDSGTLGAAALQDRANALANEKGISIQSTQVMREEQSDPFRKVAVRLTLSGEIKPFAELISGLEYGPQQLTIPFVEVTRRGAVPGQKGPRTLQATVEVSGYLQGGGAAKEKEKEGEAAEAEAEPGPAPAPADGGEAGPPSPPSTAAPAPPAAPVAPPGQGGAT